MANHTPGPWAVSTSDRFVRYRGIHGPNICDLEAFGGQRAEQEANARLIAAAPELLEALERAVQECPCSIRQRDSGHCVSCYAPQAIEAIRKAKGEL